MSGFTTAGLGIIPGTGGDIDQVVRREAWAAAHPGAVISRDNPRHLSYTARWADGSLAGSAYGDLGALMDKLDAAEAAGACPVHGPQR